MTDSLEGQRNPTTAHPWSDQVCGSLDAVATQWKALKRRAVQVPNLGFGAGMDGSIGIDALIQELAKLRLLVASRPMSDNWERVLLPQLVESAATLTPKVAQLGVDWLQTFHDRAMSDGFPVPLESCPDLISFVDDLKEAVPATVQALCVLLSFLYARPHAAEAWATSVLNLHDWQQQMGVVRDLTSAQLVRDTESAMALDEDGSPSDSEWEPY